MTWTEPRHRWVVELPGGKLLGSPPWRKAIKRTCWVWKTREEARRARRKYGGKVVKVDVLYRRAATGKNHCSESDCERPGECDGRCERWP
jgi:hypothetical protein